MAAAVAVAVAVAVVAAAALGEGQSRKKQSVRPHSVPQSGPPAICLLTFPHTTVPALSYSLSCACLQG